MEPNTLHALLYARALEMPEKICIKPPEKESFLTYSELYSQAIGGALLLLRHGCKPGDRVILGLGNSPEFFVVLFACFHAGLIAVPVDTNLAADELRVIIDHSAPSVIVVDESAEAKFRQLGAACGLLVYTGVTTETADQDEPAVPVASGDPALLLYTSGTTGHPKAVLYSHLALMSKLDALKRWFEFDESYTSLCLLPTHFGHGLICNCLITFAYAGTLIIAPPFNLTLLRKLWNLIDEHKVNTFSSVPTVIRLLLEYAEYRQEKLQAPASLRFVTCASAPLWPDEIRAFEDRFNVPLLNCYGLTETAGWSACSPRRKDRNLDSVGMAINCDMRVVGADGKSLAAGERGELQIKGPSVMRGYYRYSGQADKVVDGDGWFSTGDIGEISATGAVFLHSRIKELIIRAGKNIYPAEIDSVLMSHPDVVEACTVGLQDALMGEMVAACVVRNDKSSLGESDLIAYAQQSLADYKCPQQILFVDKIPKTSRGKINRAGLSTLFGA